MAVTYGGTPPPSGGGTAATNMSVWPFELQPQPTATASTWSVTTRVAADGAGYSYEITQPVTTNDPTARVVAQPQDDAQMEERIIESCDCPGCIERREARDARARMEAAGTFNASEWERRREQRLARAQLIQRNRGRARVLRDKVAGRRARALLRSCLSELQRRDLERYEGFRVHGSDGRLYWVAKGYSGNVYELDEQGRDVWSYCGHLRDAVPDEDHMLAQKLALETDASSYRDVANRDRGYLGQRIAREELTEAR